MKGTKRFAPALLLAVPFLVALGPDVVAVTRALHIEVSRSRDRLLRVVKTAAWSEGCLVTRDALFVNAD
jgi:hypothetical protein